MTDPEQNKEEVLSFKTEITQNATITIVCPMTLRQIAMGLNKGTFEFTNDAVKDLHGNIIAHVNEIGKPERNPKYSDFVPGN
ncbi:MAG: hypothetical protein WC375_00120 [Methanomassiliicoccales archaeon]|jgi:hypothetical protein